MHANELNIQVPKNIDSNIFDSIIKEVRNQIEIKFNVNERVLYDLGFIMAKAMTYAFPENEHDGEKAFITVNIFLDRIEIPLLQMGLSASIIKEIRTTFKVQLQSPSIEFAQKWGKLAEKIKSCLFIKGNSANCNDEDERKSVSYMDAKETCTDSYDVNKNSFFNLKSPVSTGNAYRKIKQGSHDSSVVSDSISKINTNAVMMGTSIALGAMFFAYKLFPTLWGSSVKAITDESTSISEETRGDTRGCTIF